VLQVDDLIKPRPEQVLLPALASLPWPHPNLPPTSLSSRESRLPIRRNPSSDFARKPASPALSPAKSNAAIFQNYPATSAGSAFFTVD
jgi:hypothetical protein